MVGPITPMLDLMGQPMMGPELFNARVSSMVEQKTTV
jgi:hypothetical protein